MSQQRKLCLDETFDVLEVSIPNSYRLHFIINQVYLFLNVVNRSNFSLKLCQFQGVHPELISIILKVSLHLVIDLVLHQFQSVYALIYFFWERSQFLLEILNLLVNFGIKFLEVKIDFDFCFAESFFELLFFIINCISQSG